MTEFAQNDINNKLIQLGDVVVRPISPEEKPRWKALMSKHHYLGFNTIVGEALYYIAVTNGTWLALIGWGSAALHCEERDKWINWKSQIKLPRLKFIANNARFLILPHFHIFNLASKVLSLNLKRLSRDWQSYHGHGIALAETFVDPNRFSGGCYKASNWQLLGKTKGFRKQAKKYIQHDEPKLIFIYPLNLKSIKALSSPIFAMENKVEDISFTVKQIELLHDELRKLPDHRKARGIRHSYRSVIAICICATLCGSRSYAAIAEYAGRLTQSQLKRFKPYYDYKNKKFVPPSEPTIRRMLQCTNPEIIDERLSNWILSVTKKNNDPIALDGKTLKGSKDGDDKGKHLLSAFMHNQGVVIAQREVDEKTNEITQVEPLLKELSIEGKVVTADALLTQKRIAKVIVEDKKADYVLTVKDNQPTMKADIETLSLESFPP